MPWPRKKQEVKKTEEYRAPAPTPPSSRRKKPKIEPNIRPETINKLQHFLCSREGGGELTEEQNKVYKRIKDEKEVEDDDVTRTLSTQNSIEEVKISKPKPEKKPPKKVSGKKENTNIKKDLAKKLIPMEGQQIPSLDNKRPKNKESKMEQVLNRRQPYFLLPERKCDQNQRKPSDPDYDPTSVYISPYEYKNLSDGMKRYWDIKKVNMEKIIFWRYGDWYVVYFEDLTICSKYLDMVITPFPGMPQIGFEYKNLDKNVGIMTERGYKVAVCEQKETRDQMENRVKQQQEEDQNDIVMKSI